MEPNEQTSRRAIIAVVEDDVAVGEALEGLLFAFGFAPELYQSAEAFLAGARPERIACLIVDVELKGMTGIALLRELGAAGACLPAVVVTAFGDERIRRQALAAGAAALFRKPIVPEDLLDVIAEAIRSDRRDRAGN